MSDVLPRRRSGRTPAMPASAETQNSVPGYFQAQVPKVPKAKRKVAAVAKASDSAAKKKKTTGLDKAYEERLWAKGFSHVAGIDEAGRGPLAGPVVAAACIVTGDVTLSAVMDSKLISEAERERLYTELTSHPNVRYGISVVEAADIDKMNILQATMRGMEHALALVPGVPADAVLVDGNKVPPGIQALHKECIIKGDSKCFSIAAASILAKVSRDRIMVQADKEWPEYGFAKHKGYGTKMHMAAIRKYGACPIHRRTFRPLPEVIAAMAAQGAGPVPTQVSDSAPNAEPCDTIDIV